MKNKSLLASCALASTLAISMPAFAAGALGGLGGAVTGAVGGALGGGGGVGGALSAPIGSVNAASAGSYNAMINQRVQGLANSAAVTHELNAGAAANANLDAHVQGDASPIGGAVRHATQSTQGLAGQAQGSLDQARHQATSLADKTVGSVPSQTQLAAQGALQGAAGVGNAVNAAGSATGAAALDGKAATDTLRSTTGSVSKQIDEGAATAQRAGDGVTSHAGRALDNASNSKADLGVKGSASANTSGSVNSSIR